MATRLLTFGPTGIHACAIPSSRKPDPNRRKSALSSSTNWWAPLFRLSSDPDYIDPDNKTEEAKEKIEGESETDPRQKHAGSKFSPGCFTEKKAKQLRMMITKSSSFHDVMYHSAIASRLASDFKSQSDL